MWCDRNVVKRLYRSLGGHHTTMPFHRIPKVARVSEEWKNGEVQRERKKGGRTRKCRRLQRTIPPAVSNHQSVVWTYRSLESDESSSKHHKASSTSPATRCTAVLLGRESTTKARREENEGQQPRSSKQPISATIDEFPINHDDTHVSLSV